jgi:quercetin dioxygenase-like cupin family protein
MTKDEPCVTFGAPELRGSEMDAASKETIQVGALSVRFLVEAADERQREHLRVLRPRRQQMPAPHSHDGFEETVYGLQGVTERTVDGRTFEIATGDAYCIPRGAVHGFQNRGAEDAAFLAIASPGVMSPDYFEEIHAVLAASGGGPPDAAKLGEVMRRHGLMPPPS